MKMQIVPKTISGSAKSKKNAKPIVSSMYDGMVSSMPDMTVGPPTDITIQPFEDISTYIPDITVEMPIPEAENTIITIPKQSRKKSHISSPYPKYQPITTAKTILETIWCKQCNLPWIKGHGGINENGFCLYCNQGWNAING